jgi:hypothetical protein
LSETEYAAELVEQVLAQPHTALGPDLTAYLHAIAGTVAMRVDEWKEASRHFETSLGLACTRWRPACVAPTVRGLREALDLITRSYRPELFANEPCP